MKKKKITMEHLAGLIKGSERRLGNDIEKLAIMVVNKFDQADGQFKEVKGEIVEVKNKLSGVKNEVNNLKGRMAAVEYGQYEIKQKLDIVPTRFEIAKVESKFEKRFQKIETKIGIKQKVK